MEITTSMVKHLEKLSALQHSDEEIEALKIDLAKMITMVDTLQQLNVDGVEPLLHMHNLPTTYRADEVQAHLPNKVAMQLSDAVERPYFTVPKVISH
jgi:aspartyl-tRNA(Asn)/glutamyl-tRNA(Gln) amidotransferase subunit C